MNGNIVTSRLYLMQPVLSSLICIHWFLSPVMKKHFVLIGVSKLQQKSYLPLALCQLRRLYIHADFNREKLTLLLFLGMKLVDIIIFFRSLPMPRKGHVSAGLYMAWSIGGNDVANAMGHASVTARSKGPRPGCMCAESRDIGGYETCPHGCVYCYAVGNADRARQTHKAHDPNTLMLGPATTPTPKRYSWLRWPRPTIGANSCS